MNWKLLVDTFHESYHFGFLHKDSLEADPAHQRRRLRSRSDLTFAWSFARTKLERLKATPESDWDLMWNTAIVYSLFANTLFIAAGRPHGDLPHVSRSTDGPTAPSWRPRVYIPKPVETEDEKRHWDANMELVLKVVTTEDFPAGRSMQIGFGSGAQSHVVYGRNEPALIHYHQSIRRALGLPVESAAKAAVA